MCWSTLLTVLGGVLALVGTLQQAWRSSRSAYEAALTLNGDAIDIALHGDDADPAALARQKPRDEKYRKVFGRSKEDSDDADKSFWYHLRTSSGLPVLFIGVGSVLAIVGALVAE